MSRISKQGIIITNNIIENIQYDKSGSIHKIIRPNILPGQVSIYTNKNGSISGSYSAIGAVSADIIQSLAGQTLCFSYEVNTNGDRYSTEQGQTAWNQTRYGIHGAITIGGSTNYPFAGELNYSGIGKRCYQIWTVPTGASSYGQLGFAVQNFDKPSSTNNEIWFIRNVKLEVGSSPTPYIIDDANGDAISFNEFIEI